MKKATSVTDREVELKNTFLTAYDVKEKAIVTPEYWLEWVL